MTRDSGLIGWLRRRLDRIAAPDGAELAARREIASIAAGGAAGLPRLLEHVTPRKGRWGSSPPEVAAAAGQALDLLFQALAPGDLPRLDRRLRGLMVRGGAWQVLTPRLLKTGYDAGGLPYSFCCLTTGHPSGRVRAVAVRLVAADARALPWLLMRANDWAAEVRGVARTALELQLEAAPAESWVENLPLVLRLERCRRADHRPLIERVVARLSAAGAQDALAAGLRSPYRPVRRAAFEVGAVRRRPPGRFLDAALAAGDPIVRLRAARLACERGDGEALAEQLGRDPFAAVRMLALEIRCRRPAPETRAHLLGGLSDASASIRAACQFYLRRDFGTDVAGEYRRAIVAGGAPRRLAANLSGLAETGGAGDAALALGQSSHAVTRVRASALRAAARLDAETAAPRLVEALADPAPRVARAARDALLGASAAAHAPAIRAVLRSAPQVHSRRCALEALARSGPWSYLGDLLAAILDPAPEVAERARLALEHWLLKVNRHAVPPSAAQLEVARRALDACAERLGPKLTGELRLLV